MLRCILSSKLFLLGGKGNENVREGVMNGAEILFKMCYLYIIRKYNMWRAVMAKQRQTKRRKLMRKKMELISMLEINLNICMYVYRSKIYFIFCFCAKILQALGNFNYNTACA